MAYVPFTYYAVGWKRPNLTPDEEAAIGEQVARFGKAYYRRRFRQSIYQNYLSPEQRARLEKFRGLPTWRRALQWSIFIAFFVAVFYFVGPEFLRAAAPILAFIALAYCGTLAFALVRYNRWLTHCLHRYYDTLHEK
jgi:hypothetical protein